MEPDIDDKKFLTKEVESDIDDKHFFTREVESDIHDKKLIFRRCWDDFKGSALPADPKNMHFEKIPKNGKK